jgi:PAS domain S-box-containing protein
MASPLPTASQLFPAVFSTLEGPAILCDADGRIVHVNPALERLADRGEGELTGRPVWTALFPSSREAEIRSLFHRVLGREEVHPVEVVMETPRGEAVTILWSHSVVRDADGEVALVLATGTDVTSLRRMEAQARRRETEAVAGQAREEKLRSSEARFSGIVEMASDAIIAVDGEHRIVVFNRGAEAIFGYGVDEVLGQPLDILLPAGVRPGHGDHIRAFAKSPTTARRMGERRAIAGCRKDGEEFPAEASILKLEVDGRRLFTVVLRDISERVRQEAGQRFLSDVGAALASSLELDETLRSVAERTVAELADFCIIDVVEGEQETTRRLEAVHRDPARKPLAEAFLGLRLDRARPHLMSTVLWSGAPELVGQVTQEHLASLAQGPEHLRLLQELAPRSYMAVPLVARGRTLGAMLLARSGPGRPYDTHSLEVATELGRRAGMALDNARLYQEARAAARARDDVLGVVSHDLGNPLQAIFIGLEALERARGSRGEGRSGAEEYYLTAIRRSAQMMERLIRDLLEVRRMEAGHLALDPALRELLPLVDEAMEVMDPLARVKSVELRNLLEPDALPPVSVDGDRIQQVLSNLLGNAVKHTPEGGRVILSGGVDAAELRITVRDTGPGIPQEDLDHVFDRFWRGPGSRSLGIGLGLSIARGIVRAHGGRIWAESVMGEGSAFSFTLPLDPSPSNSATGPGGNDVFGP